GQLQPLVQAGALRDGMAGVGPLSRGVPPRGGRAAGQAEDLDIRPSRYAALGRGMVPPPPRHWVKGAVSATRLPRHRLSSPQRGEAAAGERASGGGRRGTGWARARSTVPSPLRRTSPNGLGVAVGLRGWRVAARAAPRTCTLNARREPSE